MAFKLVVVLKFEHSFSMFQIADNFSKILYSRLKVLDEANAFQKAISKNSLVNVLVVKNHYSVSLDFIFMEITMEHVL